MMSIGAVCDLFERAVYTLADEGDTGPPGDPHIDALFARADEFHVGRAVAEALTTHGDSWTASAGGNIATTLYETTINGEDWLLIADNGSGETLLVPPAQWEELFPTE